MKTTLRNSGLWHLDQEFGKHLAVTEFIDRETGEVVASYVTTHDECEAYLRCMLEAEKLNDEYEFTNPKYGKHRPPQLQDKIKRIEAILEDFKNGGETKLHELLGEEA